MRSSIVVQSSRRVADRTAVKLRAHSPQALSYSTPVRLKLESNEGVDLLCSDG